MALVMARIDDRLVHGQVIVGCCEPLAADRLLVCDAAVAGDGLRQSLFAAAAPPEIEVEFVDPAHALDRVEAARSDRDRDTILLTRDAFTMGALVDAGASLDHVVVGGAHDREHTREITEGYFLTDADVSALRNLIARGLSVCFQPVPGSPLVDAAPILGIDVS